MAEPAYDYNYFADNDDESFEIPDGGIADFLIAKTGSWASPNFEAPTSGIGSVKNIGDHLAEFGRFDDAYMAHLAPNETVVPAAVLDLNPRLKAALHGQMRAAGVDPARYTVGDDANSINPVTGQREFGYWSDRWSAFKGGVKKVVKVVKRVLPVVLPIVLAMTPLGPIFGSMVGSGIASLVQGGDFKDALKAAAISGATAGIFRGIQGGIQGAKEGTGFFRGAGATLRGDVGNLGERFRQTLGGQRPVGAPYFGSPGRTIESVDSAAAAMREVPLPSGQPGAPINFDGTSAPTMEAGPPGGNRPEIWRDRTGARGPTYGQRNAAAEIARDRATQEHVAKLAADKARETTGWFGPQKEVGVVPLAAEPVVATTPVTTAGTTPVTTAGTTPVTTAGTAPTPETIPDFSSYAQEPPGFFESIKGAFTPGDDGVGFFEGLSDAFFPTAEKKAIRAGLRSNPEFHRLSKYQQFEVLTELARDSAPSFLRRWAPVLGLGSAVVAFQPTEEQEQFAAIPGTEYRDLTEVMEADPVRYRFRQALPGTTTIRQQAGTGVGPAATIRYSAHGGAIEQDFPPRDGAIAGPGSGVSDDVPAMLSDGEFVFTSKAVRGAGNGSRVQGNQTLYSLMRNFEGRA